MKGRRETPKQIVPNPKEEELAQEIFLEKQEEELVEVENEKLKFDDAMDAILEDAGIQDEAPVLLAKKEFQAGEFPGDTVRNFQEILAELGLPLDGVYDFRSARETKDGRPVVVTSIYGKK